MARQNVWGWPIGMISVGLSAVVFWEARLYADAGLQLVYVVLSVYGFWAWRHGAAGGEALRVRRGSPAALLGLFALGAAGAAGLGLLLATRTRADLPYWDASTTAFSLVAQWMQTRKWIENWVIWIVVDVVYVGMYVKKDLLGMAGLYAVFTALAVVGLWAWAASRRRAAS
jgi:nicotinamide mononucleotide transporter